VSKVAAPFCGLPDFSMTASIYFAPLLAKLDTPSLAMRLT
jgi:hypothetical protein